MNRGLFNSKEASSWPGYGLITLGLAQIIEGVSAPGIFDFDEGPAIAEVLQSVGQAVSSGDIASGLTALIFGGVAIAKKELS
jgi:hypothetical protein